MRTGEQHHLSVKRLQQQCIKKQDVISRSGVSNIEKDSFAFYDELESILGTRPTSSPIKWWIPSPARKTELTPLETTQHVYVIQRYLVPT